ncbi:MAG: hypothetical protein ACAH59_00130 [Pseudobdellovibrionaceae bacterium]
MKSWTQIFLAALLLATAMIPPQAQAISSASIKNIVSKIKETGQKLKVRTKPQNPYSIEFVDEAGKVQSEIRNAPLLTDEVKNFLPSEIAKDIKKSSRFSVGKIALQKLKRFPVESMGFFISLGALMTYDLMFNKHKNPVAFEQLIQSQMDPLGQFAFYTFMVANGISAEPFLEMIREGKIHPRFQSFFVYGGMSIGMVASNLVHELGAWPGLWKCLRQEVWGTVTLSEEKKYESCDQAMKEFTNRGGLGGVSKKWVPGLLSLVSSTLVAGLIQNQLIKGLAVISPITGRIEGVIVQAGKWTLGKVVQTTGIEIGLLLAPGGMVIKGFRVATSILMMVPQFTLFNGIQFWFEHVINDSFNNWVVSDELYYLDRQFVYDLSAIKDHRWPKQTTERLGQNLQAFGNKMKEWRQINISQVLMAQNNWEQKFGQLVLMYRSTKNFYSDFINRIWDRKYGKYAQAYASGESVSILDRIYPLNGVNIAPTTGDDSTTWLEGPELIEQRQMQTIQEVLEGVTVSQNFTKSEYEYELMIQLFAGLKSKDVVTIGRSLDQLNCLVKIRQASSCSNFKISDDMRDALIYLRTLLGDPKPIWQKGAGYLLAYRMTPAYKDDIEKSLFGRSWGTLSTPSLPEYMIAAMTAGPDLENGETALESSEGYKDLFKAPKIRDTKEIESGKVPFSLRPNVSLNGEIPDVFNTQAYQLLNEGHIRESVLNPSKSSFDDWWKKYPESEYMKAWLNYEISYQENIAQLVTRFDSAKTATAAFGINRPTDKFVEFWNRGPISNGLMTSIQQEVRLYTMILGEILKDNLILRKVPLGHNLFSSSLKALPNSRAEKGPSLMSYLKNNENMDLPALLKLENRGIISELDKGQKRNLLIQEQILTKFRELESLLRQVKSQKIKMQSGEIKTMPVSTLPAGALEAKKSEIQAFLQTISKDVFKLDQASPFLLHQEQANVARICLQGIQNLLVEMYSLGHVIDQASYVARHDQNGLGSQRCNSFSTPQSFGFKGAVKTAQSAPEGCQTGMKIDEKGN